jgi:glycosyltransferase involved in cell wall biosynthesis
MNGEGPQVSFVIPAYNAARTIGATIASLRAQSNTDWEAIIVDDGSRDDTGKVIRTIANGDTRIKFFQQENAGASAARNAGLDHAQAPLIAFLDSDDWLEPNFLETLVPLADSERTMAYCAFRRVTPRGKKGPLDYCRHLETDPMAVLANRCEPPVHCVVSPRKLIEEVGRFDTNLHTCEDWDLWLKMIRAGGRFRGVPLALAYYRMRGGSLSTDMTAMMRDAKIVSRRARRPDPRIKAGVPEYATGWKDCPYEKLVIAFDALVDERNDTSDRYPSLLREFVKAKEDGQWSDWDLANAVVELVDKRGKLHDREAKERLIATTFATDPWQARAIHEAWDLRTAKKTDGAYGRWVSASIEPALEPPNIELDGATDAVMLKLRDEKGAAEYVGIPASWAGNRDKMARAVLETLPVAHLIKQTGAVRSPQFWLGALGRLAYLGWKAPTAFVSNRRHAVGQVARAGMARAMGIRRFRQHAPPVRDHFFPVALISEVTVHDSRTPNDISSSAADIKELLQFLAEDGYRCRPVADLFEMRELQRPIDPTAASVVYCDFHSALAAGLLDAPNLPALGTEVLLAPEEFEGADPATLQRLREAGVRFGLHAGRLPFDCAEQSCLGGEWLARLREINGDDRPVSLYNQIQGISDQILREVGFEIILSPNCSPMSVSAQGPFVSSIHFGEASGLGPLTESLRPPA